METKSLTLDIRQYGNGLDNPHRVHGGPLCMLAFKGCGSQNRLSFQINY